MKPKDFQKSFEYKLKNYFEKKTYNGLEYSYSNKTKEWGYGQDKIRYKINGLFPKGYSDTEVIHLKFMKGSKIKYGAISSISIELQIREGILANKILKSKLQFLQEDYIYRLFSSMLNKTKYFKDSSVSFYKIDSENIEHKIDKFIENIELYFIKPQEWIYHLDLRLLEYINTHHQNFCYPFLSKIIVYTHHHQNFKETDLLDLGYSKFSDYKHRHHIVEYFLRNCES